MTPSDDDPLFVRHQPRNDASLALVCLPCAGGVASAYRGWGRSLPGVDVHAVQLPGRESRLREKPLRTLDALVDEILRGVDAMGDRPYALFGHSMGALLGLEVVRRAARSPVLLIVDGRHPPHRPARGPVHHRLSDDALLAELGDLGGTPARVLRHRELMDLLLPALRADFEAIETAEVNATPLNVPLIALAGRDDPRMDADDLTAWGDLTDTFSSHVLPGGHFHAAHDPDETLAIVRAALAPYVT